MNDFIKSLKQTTEEAIERGKIEREIIERQQEDFDRREQEKFALKARHVIEQIPSRAEREARAGRDHAIVYSIPFEECYKSRQPVSKDTLTGAAPLIWTHCHEAGLKPTMESWHDGIGIKSGYNIVIHWSE